MPIKCSESRGKGDSMTSPLGDSNKHINASSHVTLVLGGPKVVYQRLEGLSAVLALCLSLLTGCVQPGQSLLSVDASSISTALILEPVDDDLGQWRLSNHSNTILHGRHVSWGGGVIGFAGDYERLGSDGKWYKTLALGSYCVSGGPSVSSLAPGESIIVSEIGAPMGISSRREYEYLVPTGQYRFRVPFSLEGHSDELRSLVAYFEITGISFAQAEEALSVARSTCFQSWRDDGAIDLFDFVLPFFLHAPSQMLTELISLTEEGSEERSLVLSLFTYYDDLEPVLRRELTRPEWRQSWPAAVAIVNSFNTSQSTLARVAMNRLVEAVEADTALPEIVVRSLKDAFEMWPDRLPRSVLKRLQRESDELSVRHLLLLVKNVGVERFAGMERQLLDLVDPSLETLDDELRRRCVANPEQSFYDDPERDRLVNLERELSIALGLSIPMRWRVAEFVVAMSEVLDQGSEEEEVIGITLNGCSTVCCEEMKQLFLTFQPSGSRVVHLGGALLPP